MSITRDVSTNEQNKFVESTAVPGQPVLPVANADGTPLSVSVSASDIQIGAVEIKNATDDTRATVRDLAANDALNVAIVDGAGDQITTFGGGTQYTEGATDATITGTVSMWEDAADTVVATSATNPFPVEIIAGAGSGGTAAADDADFTAGTTNGTPAQGVYESTPTSVTDGDLGTVGITSGRRLKTSATVDAALPAGTNAIGKLAANSGVDIGDVDILSIAAGDNNIGNVDIASIAAGNNNIGDVDVASSALPTGASTSAKQDTVIGHLDGVETLLTTIAGDTTDIEAALETVGGLVVNLGANNDVTVTSGAITETNSGAIKTAVEVLDNAISGSEMQVDVVAALPAGTNAIGKLAANSGVDIGDVDVTSVTLGTYAVDDSAMPATPQTLPVSAEYRLAATTYADGDVTVLQSDENGSLKVTLANQLAGEDLTNNLLKVGGNIAHDSADAGNPVKVGGKAASSEPAAVAAADRVDAYFDTTGHQHVKVDAIAAGTANIGDVDVFSNTAKDGSGTRYQPLVDTDGHLQIDVLSGGGGGTQYTEADTDASITGTAMLWEDTSDTLRAVSAAKPLPVDIQDSTIAVTQSGTWDEVGINDSGNSITVDNAQLSVVGTGTEAAAMRVTIASDSTGVLSVDDNGGAITVDGTVAVTGVSTLAEQQTQTTHLATIAGDTTSIQTSVQLIDDTVTVLGTDTYTEASSKGLAIGAVRRDADTTLVNTTNEWGPLQMDANGRLKVEVFSGETLPVSLTSTTITGQVTIGDGTDAINVLSAGADGVPNTNNQLIVAAANYTYDVAAGDYNRAIESVQTLNTTGQGLPAVGLAAKFDDTSPQAVTENSFGHLRMSSTGVLYVGGVAAHDGVDATNPVTVGYRAIAHGTNPTAVAAADVTVGFANRAGVPFVIGGHPNPVTIEAEYTSAQTDAAIVTIATGLKIVVTQVQVMADNANSVDVGFRVGFGTANTPTTTGVVLTHPGLQSGGVMSRGDGSGIVGVGADNADLRITSEVPTSGAIRVLVTYFTVES